MYWDHHLRTSALNINILYIRSPERIDLLKTQVVLNLLLCHLSLYLHFVLFLLKCLSFFGFRFTQEPNRSICYSNKGKLTLWKIHFKNLKHLAHYKPNGFLTYTLATR